MEGLPHFDFADDLTGAPDDSAGEGVLELADVAWPGVAEQEVSGAG